MLFPKLKKFLPLLAALALCASALAGAASAQTGRPQPRQAPLTNAEFLAVLRQLPQRPGMKDQLIAEIRRRGIGVTLNAGLSAFGAATSGNDGVRRRARPPARSRARRPARSGRADARLRRQAAPHARDGARDFAELARPRPPGRRRQLPRERGREVPSARRQRLAGPFVEREAGLQGD